ncbi:MAG: family 43 glycosylhydrolase [Bacteroidales bacterium]|nr:family 43 glycosylhydrolase [Bacteroidales bacterium]
MRILTISSLLLGLFLCSCVNTQNKSDNTADPLLQAINAHDTAVHLFDDWMRDPIISIGPDGLYYLTCTQHLKDSLMGQGAPLYVSSDLAHWECKGSPYQLKNASNYNDFLEKREKMNNDPKTKRQDNLKLWAPEYHFINGRWVVIHTSNVRKGNMAMTKGEKLEAPFTDWGADFGHRHDPTLFVDDDGSVYMVSRCADVVKLKDDLSGDDGEKFSIKPSNRNMGHEGAVIVKFEGKYVFFGTGWSRDTLRKGTYNLYYCTSDKLEGPYGERKFAGRFLGHGTPFKDKEGRWWCTAFYNANHPTLSKEESLTKDVSKSAYTINKQGLTLVPLEMKMVDGDVEVRTKDKYYLNPGKEELQHFEPKI